MWPLSTQDEDKGKRSTPFDLDLLLSPLVTGPVLASTLFGSYFFYRRYLRRIPSAEFVTPAMLKTDNRRGRVIKGVVTSCGDADNFRLYHTPGPGWQWLRQVPTGRSELKDQTLHIRIAAVDAPELPHFGNPGQPYGPEALSHLKSLVEGRKVKVELLSRDRYNRIVGMAWIRRWPFVPWRRRNVSLAMTEAGLATVYRAAGAEYGGMLKKFERAERKARLLGRGMWAQKKGYESPAEYKRKHPNA